MHKKTHSKSQGQGSPISPPRLVLIRPAFKDTVASQPSGSEPIPIPSRKAIQGVNLGKALFTPAKNGTLSGRELYRLLKKGVDLATKDESGKMAEELAKEGGHDHLAGQLYAARMIQNPTTNPGYTYFRKRCTEDGKLTEELIFLAPLESSQ